MLFVGKCFRTARVKISGGDFSLGLFCRLEKVLSLDDTSVRKLFLIGKFTVRSHFFSLTFIMIIKQDFVIGLLFKRGSFLIFWDILLFTPLGWR